MVLGSTLINYCYDFPELIHKSLVSNEWHKIFIEHAKCSRELIAGWGKTGPEGLVPKARVSRGAHNPEIGRSNRPPATTLLPC